MKLKQYFRRAVSLPPHLVIKKAVAKTKQGVSLVFQRQRDAHHSTYANARSSPSGEVHRYSHPPPIGSLRLQAPKIAALAEHYLAHRFDLLGSGWVEVKHGMKCRGLEGYSYDMGKAVDADSKGKWLEGRINKANLPESQRRDREIFNRHFSYLPTHVPPSASGISPRAYVPIDWHLDFKSGYRWSESCWYMDVPYGHELGVDIKIPWELARVQHLPQLAWAYALAKDGEADFASPKAYVREFPHQVLDFIATNPPRFGVNWRCTMDVAIRVADWLVAYDLFRAYGAGFHPEFVSVFKRSVYEHGVHIINNLEWSEELRGNHYLSDIVGLLFVAAYLPSTPETDAWLAFAVQELVKETEFQFYPDGGNFEASTSYHRLSAELVIYATALVLGLPEKKRAALKAYDHTRIKVRPGLQPSPLPLYPLGIEKNSESENRKPRLESPFPPSYFERLERMAEFTMHITKPNGHIPQIGDNDSGRFLKLQPVYQTMSVAQAKKLFLNLEGYDELLDDTIYWNEDILDHRHLVAAVNGLFGREDFTVFTGDGWVETDLVRRLAGNVCIPSYLQQGDFTAAERVHVGGEEDWKRLSTRWNSLHEEQRQVIEIPVPGGDLREGLKLYAYPDFGLYIYRSRRLYLAVRCGPIGQKGYGGHAHNDQLSIELNVDGEDWINDPGTYLYTPLPDGRNKYRSVKAHFALQLEGQEPGQLDLGLFRLGNETKAECLCFGTKGFIGSLNGHGWNLSRSISLKRNSIIVIDSNLPSPSGTHHTLASMVHREFPPFSSGYGKRENTAVDYQWFA